MTFRLRCRVYVLVALLYAGGGSDPQHRPTHGAYMTEWSGRGWQGVEGDEEKSGALPVEG